VRGSRTTGQPGQSRGSGQNEVVVGCCVIRRKEPSVLYLEKSIEDWKEAFISQILIMGFFLGHRPKLLSFIGQVQPLTQQKMSNEGQRKEVDYMAQAAVGRGKAAFQPIFSHLP
jgi:hypothetical protein